MATKRVGKRYRIGVPISPANANRLLGLPVNTPLTWQEFQEKAKRSNASIKQKT